MDDSKYFSVSFRNHVYQQWYRLKDLKTHLVCAVCLVAQSCPTLCDLMDCRPGSSVPGDSPGKNTGMGCHALLQGIFPIQGLNPGLLHCRWIPEPPRKPKNTGVDSIFLLQGLSPTQKSNWGLLHCRWILYQLSYQNTVLIVIQL